MKSRSSRARASGLAIALLAIPVALVHAATTLGGQVVDVSTGQPVVGATVSIRLGSVEAGADRSGTEGRFQLTFDVANRRESQYLKLIVDHADFAGISRDVEVVSGSVTGGPIQLALLPTSVASCRLSKKHVIVVGHFRPPISSPSGIDLSARIRDALEYELMPHLQKPVAIRSEPPFVVACDAVNPRSESFYQGFAKALEADVLIGGHARAEGSRFVVEMRVADRAGALSGSPRRAATPPLDLDDPGSSKLGSPATAPILLGLASGYQVAGRLDQCVEVTAVAEIVLGTLPEELTAMRKLCQRGLPNRGLLRGGP